MLGAKLKKARQERGLSMDALSQIFQKEYDLKVTKSMISRWENNLAQPTNKYVAAYAQYFNLDLNNLIGVKARNRLAHGTGEWYADPEVAQYAEELRTNPNMRILFSAAKNISKEDMEKAVEFITFLKSKEQSDNDLE